MERRSREISSLVEDGSASTRSVDGPARDQGQASDGKFVSDQDPLTIVVASTFTADGLRQPLLFWTEALDIAASVKIAPYTQVLQELLNPESLMSRNRSGINILLIRLEDWVRDKPFGAKSNLEIEHVRRIMEDFTTALEALRERTSAPIFLFLCPHATSLVNAYREGLDKIQNSLAARVSSLQNVHFCTHSNLVRSYPVIVHESEASNRIAHIPYTNEYFVAIATYIARRTWALTKPPYKVIALDCDNTLWRGVCGEDGAAGVELTPSHLRFQQMLVRQHDSGMLLCLCSKNNPKDVEAVFRYRTDMPLRSEHLISSRVNWSSKSDRKSVV